MGENGTQKLLTSSLKKIHDQYYLLQIKDIPNNWRQLVIDFGYTSSDKPQLNTNYDVENVEDLLKKEEIKTEQVTYIFDYQRATGEISTG